ncbi:MAG: hypothetical protein AAF517_16355 [Planctomycetota bacterium]
MARMSYRRRCLLLCIVLCATVPSYAAELQLNGSIEQYHGHGRPYAWTFRKNEASQVNTDPAWARSGRHSLEFRLSLADGPEWNGRRFRVRPGGRYRATFHYRVREAFSVGDLHTFIRWWSAEDGGEWRGQEKLEDGIGVAVTADWVEVSAIVTAPAGAQFAQFHLWSVDTARGPRGRVYLDDFSMVPESTATAPDDARPRDGQEAVSLYSVLRWHAAPAVEEYDLYVGGDFDAVRTARRSSPEFVVRVPVSDDLARFASTFQPYTQYFWRVDEIREGTVRAGRVLSFSTGFDWLENLVSPDVIRYAARDSDGRGLDALQVVEDPGGNGYFGVSHSLIDGEFELRLSTSSNLIDWRFRRTLVNNADMPALHYHAPSGGYLLVHEQWGNPGSRSPSNLRVKFYPGTSELLAGQESRDYLVPLTMSSQFGSNLEGTPNFFDVSEDGDRIEIGFHFYDALGGRVDRNARGTLRGFFRGTRRWNASLWPDLNESLISNEARANIGDRDVGLVSGQEIIAVEGQYLQGDFGSWRAWFWDPAREQIFPLFPRTRRGSTAIGNMTWGAIRSPSGERAIYGAFFLFSEGAGPGESGEVVFYHELESRASGSIPSDGESNVEAGVLYWLAATEADDHEVFLGTSEASVRNATRESPEFRGRQSSTRYEPNALDGGTRYYWRIDEVFPDGSSRKGEVWSFETADGKAGDSVPGDCTSDGVVDISDAICVFGMLFLGSGRPPCPGALSEAANTELLDWNGDASVDISDGISQLSYLFLAGPEHRLGTRCVSVPACPNACGG